MFLNSLDRKPFFKNKDGIILRDLTQTMFDFKANNFLNFSIYKIPMDFEMRPDLVAQASYNNTIYTEFILKYNGISNPFSISEGDIILIPSLDSAKKNTVKRGDNAETSDAKRIRNSYKYIDPTKIPARDSDIEKFNGRNLSETTGDKLVDGDLPPNIAQDGETGITHRNGRVYFGENIGNSACLKNGMSSGEFLTKIVKSKKV